jgi:DHA3 family macrolide efflux protein-like MFS transporter
MNSKSLEDNLPNFKRNTALFLSAQAITLFGSMLVQYAMMWHVTLMAQSGSMLTIYVIVGLLPTFFISPFGGVWADRFNRKNLINISDAGIATVTLFIAIAFFAGYRSLWLIFICSAIRAVGQGIQSPAVGAFIPQIVPEEHLLRVNGINTGIQSFSALAAPMVSGALLSFLPIEYIFFIDIVTAVIGISVLQFLVKIPQKEKSAEKESAASTHSAVSYFADLKDGLRYVWRTRWIYLIVLLSTILFASMSPAAFLSPLQVARNFGSDVWRLTALEIAFSGGMMLGGLLIGFWGGFANKTHTLAFACGVIGIGTVMLGFLSSFWLYLATWIVIGLMAPMSETPCTTMLQTKTDPQYMGRVFGVFQMTWSLTMPLAMLLFGPLADVVSIDWLLIGTGIVIFLLTFPYLMSKSLREAGKSN